MKKVDIESVKTVLSRSDIGATKAAQIIEDIVCEASAHGDEREPVVKKQSVIVLGASSLKTDNPIGWVVQIPEDENPSEALSLIAKCAQDFNLSPSGRRVPLKTVADVMEFCRASICKQNNLWIKTKEPVLAIVAENKLG